MLYRAIELPSDEPVQYVGVYVLKWGQVDQPTIGFVEADCPFWNSEEACAITVGEPTCDGDPDNCPWR